MDYIKGLPASDPPSHYNSILVVVDQLTKFAVFIPTHNTDSAKELATILYAQVFSYFRLPDYPTLLSPTGATPSSPGSGLTSSTCPAPHQHYLPHTTLRQMARPSI